MEAATPLRKPSVRAIGDSVVIEALTVEDETAARLVREREEAGKDPAASVADAIEIGARVLDREQTGANADFVKAEFEKVSREVERTFGESARGVAERLDSQLGGVFDPESGHLAKALERHFSDGSSVAVQNRVKELVADAMARSREDLLKQFSAADGQNPLADFKAATIAALNRGHETQNENMRAMLEQVAALEKELQGLRDERAKQVELAAVEDKGTAKGRTFEEAVHEALDAIAAAQGDDCDAVGDLKGATGKTGDVVVGIDAACGPARGRIVFEAKNRKLSKPAALAELEEALQDRDAQFAVLVVPIEDKIPARMLALREYNGDKLIVAYDPDEGSTLSLQVAYSLARARVLMAGGGTEDVDAAAIRATAQRAIDALAETRKVKSQLTGATTSIENARGVLEAMERTVHVQLEQIGALLDAGAPPHD